MDRVVQLRRIEERVLLLVAQHFQRRLAENGEIERGLLRSRIGKHDLMRERGFAAARRAGDDVEREFRQPTAQNVIEAANAGGQLPDGYFIRHAYFFSS